MIKRYPTKPAHRQARVRAKLFGTAKRPRLTVFRSGRYIYAQIINDETGQTLAAASDLTPAKTAKSTSTKSAPKATKSDRAAQVGEALAKLANQAKITTVCFDRGPYKFHGRVKALAQAAREHGLDF